MQDRNFKITELENFIWNRIKDRDNLTLTGIDNNEINARAEALELKEYEIIEIKKNQINRLEHEIIRRQKEREKEQQDKEQKAITEREEEIRKQNEERIKREKQVEELESISISKLLTEPTTEPTQEPPKKQKKLVTPITIFFFACLVVVGLLIWKNSNSKPTTTFSNIQPISKEQQIPFLALIGQYTGRINNKEIKIDIRLEGTSKRYTYSETKNSVRTVFHYEKTNQLNFSQPEKGLGEFKVFKEENTIILRSNDNIELRKIN